MGAYRRLFVVFAMLFPAMVPLVTDHTALGATPVPRLTVGDVTAAEGDSGKVLVQVPIDLDIAAPASFSVYWKVTGGTATPGVDFIAPGTGVRTGRSAIAKGRTEAFVGVTVLGDTALEPDETVNVDVTAASGATIVRSHGTLTIQNDDTVGSGSALRADATIPRVSIGSPAVSEGNSGVRHAPVPVTLSVPAPAPITLTYQTPGTDDGSGDNCNDPTKAEVVATTMKVVFKTGQQSRTLEIPVHGNTSIGEAVTDIADSATVTSGSATIAQPTSDIVVTDDDSGGTTPPDALPPPPGTYRVSEPYGGANPTFPAVVAKVANGCGYPSSTWAAVSANGRFVAFTSNADNLVGDDTNGYSDVFLKDTWTGDVQQVSVGADGAQSNGDSRTESISGDGRYVLFWSMASNLVAGDDNAWPDSFLYDSVTGTVERIGDVHAFHDGSDNATISADGRYVAFASGAALTGGCSPCSSVFLLDRTTNDISLVSTGPGGQIASAGWPAISGDGRHVAFISFYGTQEFVKDLDTGNLERVSVNAAGQPAMGVYGTYPEPAALSYDGQTVAFTGQYCNMGLPSTTCGDGTGVYVDEVWVRDRVAGTTTVGSVSSAGTPASFGAFDPPSLSSDGRYLAFDTDDVSFAPDCPQSGPDAGGQHMYERDLSTGTTARVDVISPTMPCPSTSFTLTNQAISADGSFVTYTSLLGLDVSASNPEAVYISRLW